MRVIGGKYHNRRLHPPKEIDARPTTDFAKEGLFNVLHHSVPLEGIRVLDLFAGTGAISCNLMRTLLPFQRAEGLKWNRDTTYNGDR